MTDASTFLERLNRESTHQWSARPSTEERGGVSRAHQHLKQYGLKNYLIKTELILGKEGVFYITIEKF